MGGPRQYQTYKQLRLANQLSNENLEAAEMRQDASMSLGACMKPLTLPLATTNICTDSIGLLANGLIRETARKSTTSPSNGRTTVISSSPPRT